MSIWRDTPPPKDGSTFLAVTREYGVTACVWNTLCYPTGCFVLAIPQVSGRKEARYFDNCIAEDMGLVIVAWTKLPNYFFPPARKKKVLSFYGLVSDIFDKDTIDTSPQHILSVVYQIEDMLDEREFRFISDRYNLTLSSGHGKTLKQIGLENNLSRERVRQIICKALRKLRHPTRSHIFKGLFK